ncbi:hypothetical protein [Pararhizobium sp. A13]|uniref:hypothetical protein n=1 Tax=Pararhizobium sp. A13 TaxID=3133975 RepID=UPI00324D676F
MTRKIGAVTSPETIATNTPESEAANGEAGNPASLSPAISDDERRAIAVSFNVHPEWAIEEDEFRSLYPLTVEAIGSHRTASEPMLRITSKKAGFWRGGISHAAVATDHRALALRPAQIEAILAEAMLVIEIVGLDD